MTERRTRHFITPKQTEEARALRLSGLSYDKIALHLGFSRAVISDRCGDIKVKVKVEHKFGVKKLTADVVCKIKDLESYGVPPRIIAECLGVSLSSVYRNLDKRRNKEMGCNL